MTTGGKRPDRDPRLDDEWRAVWSEAPDISLADREAAPSLLIAIYSQLYGELRDKEKSQQQLVAWALTILTGTGLLSLFSPRGLGLLSPILFGTALLIVTRILTSGIRSLVDDRMAIARQLDRIHRVMGAFTKGYFYEESSLLEPRWYGWGFDPEGVSNVRLGRKYGLLLWSLCALDIASFLFTSVAS